MFKNQLRFVLTTVFFSLLLHVSNGFAQATKAPAATAKTKPSSVAAPAKPKQDPIPVDVITQYQTYKNALALNDLSTAISSLNYIIARDNRFSNYLDTLGLLYVQNNQSISAYLLSQLLLKDNPKNQVALLVRAVSARNIQQPLIAIDAFTELFSTTKKITYGFEKLQLQYSVKRYNDAIATSNELLALLVKDNGEKISVSKTDKNASQEVSMKAIVYNVQGLSYLDLKQNEKAIAAFQEALKVNPEYELAQSNLERAKKG